MKAYQETNRSIEIKKEHAREDFNIAVWFLIIIGVFIALVFLQRGSNEKSINTDCISYPCGDSGSVNESGYLGNRSK